jgi:ABC-type phosphate/phosphonate transport system substrate-binding protein
MVLLPSSQQRLRIGCRALVLAILVSIPFALVQGRQAKVNALQIGTSGSLSSAKDESKEKANLTTLQNFIKEETRFANEIVHQKDWREIADKMTKGDLQLGAFQGYEFAWAQARQPGLKPLALAVNSQRYPIVCVVARNDDQAKDFAGLQGQSLCLPETNQANLRLFVEHGCQAAGKELKTFFSKVTSQQSVEDALDDVVDGTVQTAVVDRAALEAYKQRKPGRFEKLKEVAKSEPLPPVVIAYHEKGLAEADVKVLRDGLMGAINTDKGKTMLTLFHLTAFETVPDDFAKVVAATLKTYPAPKAEMK